MSESRVMRGSLTPRQNEVYEYIRSCIQGRSAPPSMVEIGDHFGIRSTNGVNDLLLALERKGYIIRRKGRARGITLPENAPAAASGGKGSRRIPIVGEGNAANPLTIFMNPQGTLTPDPGLFPVTNSFAAIVGDDAMDAEGIYKGDYVIVAQGRPLTNGALVFALVGEQAMIRRLDDTAGRRWLVAKNRYYKPIPIIDGSQEVALLGEVMGMMRRLSPSRDDQGLEDDDQ